MPYVGISISSNSVSSTISIALGTITTISASTLTARVYNDNGTIQTGNNTAVIILTQRGVGSVSISASTLTVSAGVATASFRGYITGDLAILGKSTGYGDGVTHVSIYPTEGYRFVRRAGNVRGAGAGPSLIRRTTTVNNQTLYRILLWDIEPTKRGRQYLKAIIHDAKAIGVSSYLNDAGEIFFTIPYNHPQISEIKPLERHYRVDRFDEEAGQYLAISQGLIEDYEATVDEVIVYGIDYMNVLNKTMTTPSTTQYTYSSKTFSFIYQDQMTQAVNQANSRLGFIRFNAGTSWSYQGNTPLVINAATNTYRVFTGGEPRMGFLSNLANIAMEGTTNKVVFGNPLESDTEPYDTFFCDMKYSPGLNDDMVLEYGGNVKSFSYSPNYRRLRSRFLMVATNAGYSSSPQVTTIFSSIQTNTLTPTSTYGVIDEVQAMENLASQEAADARAAFQLYRSAPAFIRQFSVAVVDGSIIPFKRYKLGDDIKVRIKRGIIDIDANITLTGQRYIGNADGSEQIFFEFILRGATQFDLYSPKPRLPLIQEVVNAGLAVPQEPTTGGRGGGRKPPRGKTKLQSNTIETGAEEAPAVKP